MNSGVHIICVSHVDIFGLTILKYYLIDLILLNLHRVSELFLYKKHKKITTSDLIFVRVHFLLGNHINIFLGINIEY